MITVSETQFRIREIQLERRREIGELSDWEFRYLLQGLRACMTGGKPGVSGYGEDRENRTTAIYQPIS